MKSGEALCPIILVVPTQIQSILVNMITKTVKFNYFGSAHYQIQSTVLPTHVILVYLRFE